MSSPKIAFRELENAFDFVSSGQPSENTAFLCLGTGEFYWHSVYADFEESLPDDLDEFIELPHKKDLGLGKPLALQFAKEILPNDFEKVREIFSRRGAYARFRDLLEYRDAVEQWYEYEAGAQDRALREWCKDNDIEVDG